VAEEAATAEEETTSEEDIKPFFHFFLFSVIHASCAKSDYLMFFDSQGGKLSTILFLLGFLKS
jgi:hypothetical protein